jgi:hypothetical protein|tara:strand:+ start:652 stop:867 length:216 start_codon:yes stop_codon:yes gene_type:complete
MFDISRRWGWQSSLHRRSDKDAKRLPSDIGVRVTPMLDGAGLSDLRLEPVILRSGYAVLCIFIQPEPEVTP